MMRTFGLATLAALAFSPAAFAQSAPAPMATGAVTMEHIGGDALPTSTRMPVRAGEEEVDPYTQSNANAGAAQFTGAAMLEAFHGREGIGRIVHNLVLGVRHDPRMEDIFHEADFVRLERTLNEQFCYILNGGCDYTGRDMKSVHKDHGVAVAEFNALVELLQDAMDAEHVTPAAQNRFLAKLAPMKRDVVVR